VCDLTVLSAHEQNQVLKEVDVDLEKSVDDLYYSTDGFAGQFYVYHAATTHSVLIKSVCLVMTHKILSWQLAFQTALTRTSW